MPAPPPRPRDFASHSLERKCQKNSATEEDGVHRSWSRSREINRSPASLCPSSSVAFSSSLVLPIPPTPHILRIGFSGRTSWTLWTLANRSKKWRRSSRSWFRSVKSFRADCRAARRSAALMDLRIGINAKTFDAKAFGMFSWTSYRVSFEKISSRAYLTGCTELPVLQERIAWRGRASDRRDVRDSEAAWEQRNGKN